MLWCRASFFLCCASALLCSARAAHRRRRSARVKEGNGMFNTVSQILKHIPEQRLLQTFAKGDDLTNAHAHSRCRFVGFDWRNQHKRSELNAGSTSFLSWSNEEAALRSAVPEGPWRHSLYVLIDQLRETVFRQNHQRGARHTLPQMGSRATESSKFPVQFEKCAQVVTGSKFPQVRVSLVVKNLEGGTELSQLHIRDTVSDIISLQTNGTVQDRQYQTFNIATLPAGSSYAVSYTASVKRSTDEHLFLPAFLTFSSTPQNINVSGSVVANFTLRINTTEKVCVNHALHFAGFCLAFLSCALLLSLMLLTVGCVYKKCLYTPPHKKRRSFIVVEELEEPVCNASDPANEDATFEDRIIDIMALEDPQDMSLALDNLEKSSMLRDALMLECVRVQMLKGVFRVLTARVSGSNNEVNMVDLLSHVTEMQEDQKSQLSMQSNIEAHTDRQDVEQRRLEALRRREELHDIISEEIEEAAMTGGTHMTNQLLRTYYSCQDQLESVLDLFVANQRAALSEQQAQRRFLLQGLQDLQRSMCDMFRVFSRHIDSWFTRIRREGVLSDQHCVHQLERAQSALQCVQERFEETLVRERNSAHRDIIKTRRARITKTLCEQKHEQQDLECGLFMCDGPLEDYLMRWQMLLCAHNTHLSELITHLDQDAAAHIRRVLVCVLRDAVADLKQLECETSESLQEAGVPRWLLLQLKAGSVVGGCLADTEAELGVRKREAAKTLRLTRSRVQQIREQELQQQRERRARMQTYCRSMWESQCTLSESDLLRMQLEYVKSVCHLDRCLALPPANQSTKHTLDGASGGDPIFARVCMCKDEMCVCEDEERVTTQVVAVQWDKVERKSRVLETHSALLTLQTLLMQTVSHTPVGDELSHAIHTHSSALEEAELLLQKEECEWEQSMDGLAHNKLLTRAEEEMFRVNTDCMISECLQEALYKRQQLTHILTERLRMDLRRQQVMEDLRDQQELKRLYTYFDQDLLLVALLVKWSGVSEPDLRQLLCLLLPTQPDAELQSLIHTLAPIEGRILGPWCHLVDGLRNDIISKRTSPQSRTHSDRMLKKKQKLVEKLFCKSQADESGQNLHPASTQAIAAPEPPVQKEEESSTMAGETMPEEAESTSHAGEAEDAAGGEMMEERLFTICSRPGGNPEHAHVGLTRDATHHTPHSSDASDRTDSQRRRRKFKFKKGAVAPQEQTK